MGILHGMHTPVRCTPRSPEGHFLPPTTAQRWPSWQTTSTRCLWRMRAAGSWCALLAMWPRSQPGLLQLLQNLERERWGRGAVCVCWAGHHKQVPHQICTCQITTKTAATANRGRAVGRQLPCCSLQPQALPRYQPLQLVPATRPLSVHRVAATGSSQPAVAEHTAAERKRGATETWGRAQQQRG